MSLDQLSPLETTVLTFGITTILLLGTTFYYIKQRKNNNNDNSGAVVEEESVKELDLSVSFIIVWCYFTFAMCALLLNRLFAYTTLNSQYTVLSRTLFKIPIEISRRTPNNILWITNRHGTNVCKAIIN